MAIIYRAIQAPQNLEAVEAFLNEHGKDNWELVCITPHGGVAVFKKTGAPTTLEEQPS